MKPTTNKTEKLVVFMRGRESSNGGCTYRHVRALLYRREAGYSDAKLLATVHWQTHKTREEASDWYGWNFELSSSDYSCDKLGGLQHAVAAIRVSQLDAPAAWWSEMEAKGWRRGVYDRRESRVVAVDSLFPPEFRMVAAKCGEVYPVRAMARDGGEEYALTAAFRESKYATLAEIAEWVNGGKAWRLAHRGDEAPTVEPLAGMLASFRDDAAKEETAHLVAAAA